MDATRISSSVVRFHYKKKSACRHVTTFLQESEDKVVRQQELRNKDEVAALHPLNSRSRWDEPGAAVLRRAHPRIRRWTYFTCSTCWRTGTRPQSGLYRRSLGRSRTEYASMRYADLFVRLL
jgi:hypothetical protein